MTTVGIGAAGAGPTRVEVNFGIGGDMSQLLENEDQRLDDAVWLFGHHRKRRCNSAKEEAMRGQGCGVHAAGLQQAQQPVHPLLTPWAKRGANDFITQLNASVNPWYAHLVTMAVVSDMVLVVVAVPGLFQKGRRWMVHNRSPGAATGC